MSTESELWKMNCKFVKSINELTKESDARAKTVAEDLIVKSSTVIKRDKDGRTAMIRKTFVSGVSIDYKVIRDKEGHLLDLRAID